MALKVIGRFGEAALADIPAEVERAELLGFDGISTSETAHEALSRLAIGAHLSRTVGVGTSVLIAFARSPFVVAQAAWELQQLTGGRITIGLGSQVKGHNERRFSSGPWVAPARRMEEYVLVMRAVWETFQTGRLVPFEGEHYNFTLCPPTFSPGPIDYPPPLVHIAAVGAAMTRVAGRVADGLIPHSFTTESYLRDVTIPNLHRAAREAGRDPSDIEVSTGGLVALVDSEDQIEPKLMDLRQPVSFYGSTRTYLPVMEAHGWGDLGMRLHELSVKGEWGAMVGAVPLEVAREFALVGTYESLAGIIASRSDVATSVGVSSPAGDSAREERFAGLIERLQQI